VVRISQFKTKKRSHDSVKPPLGKPDRIFDARNTSADGVHFLYVSLFEVQMISVRFLDATN